MTGTPTSTPIAPWQFDMYVDAEVDGEATPEQLAILQADPVAWNAALLALLRDAEDHLASARALRGEEREQVIADLESEHRRLADAWARRTGQRRPETTTRPTRPNRNTRDANDDHERRDEVDADDLVPGVVEVQVSWEPGRVVAWAAGRNARPVAGNELVRMLETAGAPHAGGPRHGAVPLPGGARADAQAIPVGDVLGWLVAAGAGQVEGIGESVRWLGGVAIWAVELTARGAMVPFLRQRTRRGGTARDSNGSYSVRWTPALVDPARLARLIETIPGALLALDSDVDARALTRSALTGMVDAICRDGARQLEMPAPPPTVRTATDVAEAFLGRLDGSAFDAPTRLAGDIATRIERWGRSVTGERGRLIVRLDPPDDANIWHLAVFATGNRGEPLPIEQAIVNAGAGRPHLEDEITRLERMLPALLRPGGTRRGEVILSQDEAWDLMATTGPQLEAAGFDVRVPALSRRKPTPSLRVFVDASKEATVGANQLADVRWSAVFDDVELTATDIARLAREARPLIRSGGRWVALDKADLQAAADALAERAETRQLSGAATLRLALGIEGSALIGGVSVVGGGWAAELLEAAAEVSSSPAGTPAGFVGELRSYQAEALSWLGFLTRAGLGGCLALDMGLGKTPTMLADLLAGAGSGPALVIAPPAVVGNWTAEAAGSHRAFEWSCTTARTGRRPRRSRATSPAPTWSSPRTAPRCGTSTRSRRSRGRRSSSTRRRRSRTRRTRRRSSCAGSTLARRSRSPARRSRTGSAISGPSSTSRTPGSSVPDRSSSRASATRVAPRCARRWSG